ncbi:MAG: hypothetical protein H0U49_10545 [Parachlamydiaceae bacterium]|nr:hypothetical protein [Parachlamydiaceae bacterium]
MSTSPIQGRGAPDFHQQPIRQAGGEITPLATARKDEIKNSSTGEAPKARGGTNVESSSSLLKLEKCLEENKSTKVFNAYVFSEGNLDSRSLHASDITTKHNLKAGFKEVKTPSTNG